MKYENDENIKELFHNIPRLNVPSKLVFNTLKLIEKKDIILEKEKIFEFFISKIRRLKITLALISALFFAILPLTFLTDLTKIFKSSSKVKQIYVVKFIYRDNKAKNVFIVGDFNDWDKENIAMKRIEGTDLWVADITLNEGTYRYNFLVNGEKWAVDPLSKIKIKDRFGNESSLLVLLPTDQKGKML